MNFIFFATITISIIMMCFSNPTDILSTINTSIYSSLLLCLTLCCIYVFWCGLMQIAQDSGLQNRLTRMLSPIIDFIFGKQNTRAKQQIATNLSANMLGLGGVATPSAIDAMQQLEANPQTDQDKQDIQKGKITRPMAMLFIISATSIQLLPTTIIGLLQQAGDANPSSIILPTLVCTAISTAVGIILVAVIYKLTHRRKRSKTE